MRERNEIFLTFLSSRCWVAGSSTCSRNEDGGKCLRALRTQSRDDPARVAKNLKSSTKKRKWKWESSKEDWQDDGEEKRLWKLKNFLMINHHNFHLTRVLMFNIIRTSTASSSHITKSFIISYKSIAVVGCCLFYPARLDQFMLLKRLCFVSWGGERRRWKNFRISFFGRLQLAACCVGVHKSISCFYVLYSFIVLSLGALVHRQIIQTKQCWIQKRGEIRCFVKPFPPRSSFIVFHFYSKQSTAKVGYDSGWVRFNFPSILRGNYIKLAKLLLSITERLSNFDQFPKIINRQFSWSSLYFMENRAKCESEFCIVCNFGFQTMPALVKWTSRSTIIISYIVVNKAKKKIEKSPPNEKAHWSVTKIKKKFSTSYYLPSGRCWALSEFVANKM